MTPTPASLPSHARYVVIGGGVMGCSLAYHLAKLGAGEVVLLERGTLTCGTTWHSAAQVRQLRSTRNLTELIKYSARLYASLAEETGQETGWTQTGSVSIATTPDRLIHIRRQAALARLFGVEAEEIGADDVKRMWPLANVDDVIGAVYSPSDGRVNPSDLCQALVKGAKAHGARIFEGISVDGIETAGGRVSAVRTADGRIACEAIADCAGLWGRRVAHMADVSAPLYACEHFYLLTKPIDGIDGHLPTLSDHDGHLYLRDDVGGLLVGCFEPKGKPLALDALPPDFAFDLLNEDWDHFEPMMLNAMHRLPVLETAEVRMLLNGPESFTPDGSFLLGEVPELAGFYLGCGMNSVGVASAGGAGQALAQWMVDDAAPMDLWSVDPRRFATVYDDDRVLADRVSEVLGLHYAIAYPGREHASARNLRTTPLHEELAACGARFGERAGWERPLYFVPDGEAVDETLTFGRPGWFDLVAAECRATREAVALFDQSTFAKIEIAGPQALALLQRVCANDMDVRPGRIVYTAMLNDRGGFESDLTVIRRDPDHFLMMTGTAQGRRDLAWLRRHAGSTDGVALRDVTDDHAVIALSGPRARDVLARVTDADLSDAAFPFYTAQNIQTTVGNVLAARLSYAGELGWELYVAPQSARDIWKALRDAGADAGIRPAGILAMTALRIEKGFRAWGHDVTPDDTPLEAGLAFACRRGDEDFIGASALQRQRNEGIRRRLVFLTLDAPAVLAHGHEPILLDGRPVGQVTSAAFGHTVGRTVCMGYVPVSGGKVDAIITAGHYEIDIAGDAAAATVSLTPPLAPSKSDRA